MSVNKVFNVFEQETKQNNYIAPKKKTNNNALIGSIIGTSVATFLAVSSSKNKDKFIKQILKTDFASPKNMIMIAAGSILGGLAGGIIKDNHNPDNTWRKIKESNFQMISNIIFPLIFLNIFKNATSILTKTSTKLVKNITTFMSVFAGVVAGAFVGSKVANKLNKDIIKPEIPYERGLEPADFFVHIDDIPVALAFSNVPYVDKLIPLILTTRGYQAGNK